MRPHALPVRLSAQGNRNTRSRAPGRCVDTRRLARQAGRSGADIRPPSRGAA